MVAQQTTPSALDMSVSPSHAAISGEIDMATEVQLESALAEAAGHLVERRSSRFVLDLGGVEFCSAAGLSLIESFLDLVEITETELQVVVSTAIERIAGAASSEYDALVPSTSTKPLKWLRQIPARTTVRFRS